MYTDIITYKLASGKTSADLMAAAKQVHSEWMSKQAGFIKWTIHEAEDGLFVDTVEWESKDAAKQAETSMNTSLPQDHSWFSCYDLTSISSTAGEVLLAL